MRKRTIQGTLVMPFSAVLASSFIVTATLAAQPTQGQAKPSTTQAPATSQTQSASPNHLNHEIRVPSRAKEYFQSAWGVDKMLVHRTASGNLIRFSYRVTDPVRAKTLGDNHATPYLFGQRSHALLHIPVMEKIGQLRQTGIPEAGKEYWMVFSNKGDLVKDGDRVNVIIGSFHADGLTVE